MSATISTVWLRAYLTPHPTTRLTALRQSCICTCTTTIHRRHNSGMVDAAVRRATEVLASSSTVRKIRQTPITRHPLRTPAAAAAAADAFAHAQQRQAERLQQRKLNKAAAKQTQKQLLLPAYITIHELSDLLHMTTAKLHIAASQLFTEWWPYYTRKQLRKKFGYVEIKNMILKYVDAAALVHKLTNNKYAISEHTDIERTDLQPAGAAQLQQRTPVVSILGHKDHGKTTLVDALRQTNVAKYEEYGITQELYSYTAAVTHSDNSAHPPIKATILDTPGHHTFTDMRKTAGWFSDINLVVISADRNEGMQQQTIEALEVARSYDKTPFVVVINKVDSTNADVPLIRKQLTEYGLRLVDVNHKFSRLTNRSTVPCVEISAKQRINLDALYTVIHNTLQRIDLRTDMATVCRGAVLESYREDKGRGNVVRAIVQHGTLRHHDHIVCGLFSGRVKELRVGGRKGQAVTSVMAGVPVEIMGCEEGLPSPGTEMIVCSQQRAEAIAQLRRNEDSYDDQMQRLADERANKQLLNEQRREERLERQRQEAMMSPDYVDPDSVKRSAVDEHIALKHDEEYEPSIATTFEEVDATDNAHTDMYDDNAIDTTDQAYAADETLTAEHVDDAVDVIQTDKRPVVYDNMKELRRAASLDNVEDDGSPRTIIVKANHTGGLRMLVNAVDTIHSDVLKQDDNAYGLNLLSCNSGGVNKHDIVLAAVDRSPILLFRTQMPSEQELIMARQAGVPIKHYRHFERLLADLTEYATTGLLPGKQPNKYAKQVREKQVHKPLIKGDQLSEAQL